MPTSLDVSLNYVENMMIWGVCLASGCLSLFTFCYLFFMLLLMVMCIRLFTENNCPKGTIHFKLTNINLHLGFEEDCCCAVVQRSKTGGEKNCTPFVLWKRRKIHV